MPEPGAGEQEFRYRAFLSYARADNRAADRLHKALENYRTPKSLVGSKGAFGPVPPKLYPIFRDRTDMAAGGNLSERIRGELAASEALILLCSPSAAKSKWVNEEVRAFCDVGGENRIFPVIAAGEPESGDLSTECFPPALRGTGVLAADLRQTRLPDGRIIGDGPEGAYSKVIAGILGVPLDALLLRERERQRRRIRFLAGIIAGLILVAGGSLALGVMSRIELQRLDARYVGRQLQGGEIAELANSFNVLQSKRITIGWVAGDLETLRLASNIFEAAKRAGANVTIQPSLYLGEQPASGVTVSGQVEERGATFQALVTAGVSAQIDERDVDRAEAAVNIVVGPRPAE